MAQAIERAIALIRRAAEQPLSLGDAAEVLGVHKSTALRILQTLESARFVRKTGAGSYVVGSGIIELSELALGSMDLRQSARPHLSELQRRTGHTVHLAQLTGDEVIYVDKVDSPALDGVQLPSRIGRAVSIYASAVGKTILAYRSPEERDHLLREVRFEQFTPTTFANRDALDQELKQIRERGWASDNGEHDSYVMCVAVPIRDSRRDVIAALSVTAIEVIATLETLQENVPLLLNTAEAISREIGYVPPAP